MPHSKIKILHVTEPSIDGVKTHVVDLLSHLNTELYEITLLYSTKRSDPRFKHELEVLKARGIQALPSAMSGQIKPIEDLRAFIHMLNLVRSNKFEIVHCHSSKAGFLARVACKLLHVPITIYTPHAFPFQNRKAPLKRMFYVYLERLAAKFCDRIICVSQQEKKSALAFKIAPSEKFQVIPNAINFQRLQFSKKINLTERYPNLINHGDIIITTVGRLSYQKAPEVFVKAASIVAQQFSHVKFLWIGTGDLKKSIARLALNLPVEKKIIFTGYRNDVFDLLKSSDIFVLTSRYEGLPYSILEAMASRLPVVATKVTGTSELVTHGKTGILVPPENEHALANAILSLIHEPEKRKKLGVAGYNHVIKDYSLDPMIRSTENLYQELFRRKHNSPVKA